MLTSQVNRTKHNNIFYSQIDLSVLEMAVVIYDTQWFRACKQVTAIFFSVGFITGGTIAVLGVLKWFDALESAANGKFHDLPNYMLHF